jgi:hypothetical protein
MRITQAGRRSRTFAAGQSVVEFTIVFPLLLLMVVAIADFGRLYTSMVAVESAAREAADFGSFHANSWTVDPLAPPPGDNRTKTVAEMQRRACTAAAGSHLEGYSEPAGTVGHATCTNPVFTFELVPDAPSCSDPLTEPPCVVLARMDYDFTMILAFPPLPGTIHITRESRFRMQDLTPP